MKQAIVILAAGAVISSCSQKAEQMQDGASVDDQTLTVDAIHRQIDTSNGISEMQVRTFARQWVNSELLYQEAKRQGLDHSESVLKDLDDAKRHLAINALLEKEVFNDAPQSVSKEEITIYFRNHQEEFALHEDVVYISLAVFSERNPAVSFREAALEGEGWDAAVAQFQNPSDEKSSMITKTDSAFYTQGTLFPAKLWKVSSALGVGEVSFPVKTDAGYFVLLSLGNFQRGSIPPVEYVESAIRGRLLMERRQQRFTEYLETVRKKHTVQINLTGLSADHDSLSQQTGE